MLSLDLLTRRERLSWSSAPSVLLPLVVISNLGFGQLSLTSLVPPEWFVLTAASRGPSSRLTRRSRRRFEPVKLVECIGKGGCVQSGLGVVVRALRQAASETPRYELHISCHV